MPRSKSVKQSFWIDDDLNAGIEKFRGESSVKITKTQFFIEAAIEKLSGRTEEATLQELQRTQEQLAAMRLEMAHVARALLTQSGEDKQPMKREDVMVWISEYLDGKGVK